MTEQEQAPTSGPTLASTATQAEWERLTAQNLPTVRECAGKWRDGLAALITLVTAGLVVSGPEKAGDLPAAWQWTVGLGLVGGMLATLVGLLLALAAAAGVPTTMTFAEFVDRGGSRVVLETEQATKAATRLRSARRWAIPGIVVVLLAIGVWLVSPTKPGSSLQVTTADTIYCGELSTGDGGMLTMKLKGESQPVKVSFDKIQNLAVVETCKEARSQR